MAREAVARATGAAEGQVVQLRDVTWLRPCTVQDDPVALHNRLSPDATGEITVDIFSTSPGPAADEILHARGVAVESAAGDVRRIDIAALTGHPGRTSYSAEAYYAALGVQGLAYGARHRGIDTISVGPDDVVARLVVPSATSSSLSQFVLHPSMTDAALQAIVAFYLAQDQTQGQTQDQTQGQTPPARPLLPFALRSATVYRPCTPCMWAVVRRAAGAGHELDRFDIDLCDEDGRVCLELRDLTLRPVGGSAEPAAAESPREQAVSAVPDADQLTRDIQAALIRMIAATRTIAMYLKMPTDQLIGEVEFEALGFDSIVFIEFADKISDEYGLTLTPTTLFEYPTLDKLSGYLAEEHRAVMASRFPPPPPVQAVQSEDAAPDQAPAAAPVAHARFWPTRSTATSEADTPIADADEPGRRSSHAAGRASHAAGRASHAAAWEPIAIVGISGRFPMARDVDEFWDNLRQGRDCISEIPPTRWDWRAVYGDPQIENATRVRDAGLIDGIDEFDPGFFKISPREAQVMDPQQRLLMMHIWKAIEDAGYAPSSLAGSHTGIFVGTGMSGYDHLMASAGMGVDAYSSLGIVPSIGPNRMSFFLDLHGPSEPIETACSSSLIAVHRAMWAIRNGHCEMALAGGVSTLLRPDLHISFDKAGMLSPDGRCKAFSDRADGFGRGEGVGVVFLKGLAAAEADGDHIYGVLLASAENHGGRASSLTAPNPKAQAELLVRAYTEAGIDPATVTYIEAHGTGTPLGDPIEIDALKAAFRTLYGPDRPSAATQCGLGTVKSNIGHLEMAAGVAGLIKVLLQMQHGTLAKTLHCETINPYIQLEGSPFHFVRETTEWRRSRDAGGDEVPRRAGVSSFGFGGVNAHLVLEEYVPPEREPTDSAGPDRRVAILLSARDEARLREQASGLLAVVDTRSYGEGDLRDIAYTLQMGRNAMAVRTGFLVSSLSELRQRLRALLARTDGHGIVSHTDRDIVNGERMLTEEKELHTILDRWTAERRLEGLLDLWLKGMTVAWERLYDDPKPRRISLPTYPFARERCWVPRAAASDGARSSRVLQPDAEVLGCRFSAVLTGDEFFLADHVVRGQHVLPAVVSLEMARLAMTRASGSIDGRDRAAGGAVSLRDIVWLRPLAAGPTPTRIHLRLTAERDDYAFEIYSALEERGDGTGGDRAAVTYAQGHVRPSTMVAAPVVDVAAVRARCGGLSVSADECYAAFAAMGYAYGPAQRGIVSLGVGTDEILAELQVPASVADTLADFVLHPAVADAAVQATLGFALVDQRIASQPLVPLLPFELQRAEIFHPCTPRMWAVIRRDAGRCDIDLCDRDGRVTARFNGWAMRRLESGTRALPAVESGPTDDDLVLMPTWESIRIERQVRPQELPPLTTVVIGATREQLAAIRRLRSHATPLLLDPEDTIEAIATKIESLGTLGHLVWLVPSSSSEALDSGLLVAQRLGVLVGFRLIKALLAKGYHERPLTFSVWTVGTQAVSAADTTSPAHASVHGLVGSMAKEHPAWHVRLIDLPASGDWPWDDLLSVAPDPHGNAVAYRHGCWYQQQLVPYRPAAEPTAWARPGDVYVVIGGAGGIGAAWSEALLQRSAVQLVWIGRRPKDDRVQALIDRLAALGPRPLYIAADATNRQQLEAARDVVLREFGRIDGLVHAALVLRDRSLTSMTEDDFTAGLAPKVDVCVRLAQVFASTSPRFVLFCSSLNAFSMFPGQSNYVAGCTFTDAFARRLAAEWPCHVRVINWGYWGRVGAVASDHHRSAMARRGLDSIDLSQATHVLDQLLSGPIAQLVHVRTLGPMRLPGVTVRADAWMTRFPEGVPSCLEDLEPVRRRSGAAGWVPSPEWLRVSRDIDDALVEVLWTQLSSMGLFPEASASCEAPPSRPGIPPRYARWFDRSLEVLETHGRIVTSGQDVRVSDAAPVDIATAWERWERRAQPWLHDDDWRAWVQLAERGLRALPEIWAGRRVATDVLFADLFGDLSTSLVATALRSGPVSRLCNRTIAAAVAQYADERRQRDPNCRLRILEIGAGTGATSEAVFEGLSPHADLVQEYTYSDLSPGFLTIAGRSLPARPAYVQYATFDVEHALATQRVVPDSYDVVIASNVLHATRDIRRSIRNAKAALRTNGLLVLGELTATTLLHHVTFGLLDGWWLFTDSELRLSGGPALRSDTWRAVLEQEGFQSVQFPAAEAHDAGQQVILAVSDGVVRQDAAPSSPLRPSEQRPVEEPHGPRTAGIDVARATSSTPFDIAAPREIAIGHLLSELQQRVARTLGLDVAALDSESRPFADALLGEFGMDSISSNDFRLVLRREFGVDIPVERIIGDKVRSLVDALYDQLLLQQVTAAKGEDDEARETYVF
jgi:acyl transferase domain-containing protein/SAM-dependent methyltransferase